MQISNGSKIGIHGISPQRTIPLVAAAKARGSRWPLVKGVDNGGIAMDVKRISPQTLTITRFVNEAEDSAQDVDKWTPEEVRIHANKAIDDIALRLNPDEIAAADWLEPINEADPPDWTAFGIYLCELVKVADDNGVKIALPAFNSGTPEWPEMKQLVNTGLFGLMARGGHILTLHEGWVGGNFPITNGFGDRIPGAPVVSGAGSVYLRYRYLYSLLAPDERPGLVISEWYGGPYNISGAEQVARMAWYDNEVRKDPYVLAFLPFTIDPPTDKWQDQNYSYAYDAVLDYLVAEKDKPNGVTPSAGPLKIIDRSKYQEKPIDSSKNIYEVRYDPVKLEAAGYAGTVHRLGVGTVLDSTFREAVRRDIAAWHPWGVYHVFRTSRPWQEQVAFILGVMAEFGPPPLGFWTDLEGLSEGAGFFVSLKQYMIALDAGLRLTVGIYSIESYLVRFFTAEQLQELSARPAWWGNNDVPAAWKRRARPYEIRQHVVPIMVPGVYGVCDVDDLFPGMPLSALGAQIAPPPPPPPAGKHVLWGLHGRADGPMQEPDWTCVRVAKIETLKLMSTARPEDVDRANALGLPLMVRCFNDFSNRTLSSESFAADMIQGLVPFYERGVRMFEVHNEPNIKREGWGSSWQDGREFGNWFIFVRNALRLKFPLAWFGWPGLSPGLDIGGVRDDSERFLNAGIEGARKADFICVHCYFQNASEIAWAIQQVRNARALLPGKPVYVTEFSNPNPNTPDRDKAAQYIAFVQALSGLAEGAFSFVSSGSHAGFLAEVWRYETGNLSSIAGLVGQRPPEQEEDMTTTAEKKALQNAVSAVAAALMVVSKQVDAIVPDDGNWWDSLPNGVFPLSRQTRPNGTSLTLYGQPRAAGSVSQRNDLDPATYVVDIYERQGEFLRVTNSGWWVKATQLKPFA